MQNNTQYIARSLFSAWSLHDVDTLISLFTPDLVYKDVALGMTSRSKDELKSFVEATFVWSPDVKFELKSLFATDDHAASEWTMSGTHSGDFPGMPATGKTFSVRGVSITEIRNGKISRNTDYWNLAAFLMQVGLLPSGPG